MIVTDKLEVDGALLLPPLSINAAFQGYLKLVKATQKGEKLKYGCVDTGDRTRDLAHRRLRTNQLYHPCSSVSPGGRG